MAEDNRNSQVGLAERRRSGPRIVVNMPVEISRTSPGPPLSEKTFIEDVSDFGCRFSTHGAIQQGDSISVKLLGPNGRLAPEEEARVYEVMWVARKERSYTAGARLIRGDKLGPENSNSPSK